MVVGNIINTCSKKWMITTVLLLCFLMLYSQETADVNIRINNPVSGSLSQLQQRVFFDITTNFSQTREVALEIVIEGISGEADGIRASNEAIALGTTVNLNAGINSFNYVRLSAEGGEGYSIDNLSIVANQSQRDLIENQRQLPPGDYSVCMRVFDPISMQEIPKSMSTNNCNFFNVAFFDAPRIAIPNDPDQIVSVEANPDNNVFFRWNVSTGKPTEYTLIIRRFSDFAQAVDFNNAGRPQDYFDGLETVARVTTTMRNYNSIMDGLMFEDNVIYACQVVANTDGINYLNAGRSNIPLFSYGSSPALNCQSPSYIANLVYPVENDTLPFFSIPHVVKFSPICDNLLEASTEFLTSTKTGTPHNVNKNRNWRNVGGPYNFLVNYVRNNDPGRVNYWLPSRDVAGYLLLDDITQVPYIFDRGENYKSSAKIVFKHRIPATGVINTSDIQLLELFQNGIVTGMPTPVLRYPENQVTSSPGNIAFQFNTGENPRQPLPEYKLMSIDNHQGMIDMLYVLEKCVLQVSTNPDFSRSSIVTSKLKKIQVEASNLANNYDYDNPIKETWQRGNDFFPDRHYDYSTFMERVYRDFDIPITLSDEGTYYWRVVWLKEPDNLNVSEPHLSIDISEDMIYHKSETRTLTISSSDDDIHQEICDATSDSPGDENSDEESECVSDALPPVITNTTLSQDIFNGDMISIGMFELELVEISRSGEGNAINGKGKVLIDFLNGLWINVTLNALKINTDKQVISGSISPVKDQEFPITESIENGVKSFGMSQSAAEALSNTLYATDKLLSLTNSGSTISLPLGIDKEIAGEQFTLGIIDFSISATEPATIKAIFNTGLDFLEIPNAILSLGAEIQFHPDGLGSDGKMYKPSDIEIPLDNGNYFVINGAEGREDIEKVCYVKWDCNGFKCLNLAAGMKFSREVLLPDGENGEPGDGQVKFDVFGKFCSESNYIFGIDGPAFQIPGISGWAFNPTNNLYLDLSDTENVPGFDENKPEEYQHGAFDYDEDMTDEQKQESANTWKGFYLGQLELKAPQNFVSKGDERLNFAINNLIIDETGVSLSFLAKDVLGINEGNNEDFKFSIDSIYMNITQNSFVNAGFSGDFGVPYTQKNEYLHYQGVFEQSEREEDEETMISNNFVLTVTPKDNFKIPLLIGEAKIDESTKIELSLGDHSFLNIDLVATLNIGNEYMSAEDRGRLPSSLNMPEVRIENLKYHSDHGFEVGEFNYSLASPQKTMSGFPISLEKLSISGGKNPTLNIEPKIILIDGDEDGFSASAGIEIITKFEDGYIELDKIKLKKVSLDLETSGLSVKGELEFYQEEPIEGLKGSLLVDFKMGGAESNGGFKAMLNANFGSYKEETATNFNSSNWYSYYFVDGIIALNPGVSLFSGLDLYGLGGGFAKNMRRKTALPSGSNVVWDGNHDHAKSSTNYEPQFGKIGLNFLAILGSQRDKGEKYNMDLQLSADFSSSGGLLKFEFKGSFRIMDGEVKLHNIGNIEEVPVGGYLRMTYRNPSHGEAHFDGLMLVKVNIEDILTGRGVNNVNTPPGFILDVGQNLNNAMVWASMYVGPDKWYYYMGTPDPNMRGGLKLNLPGTEESLIEVDAYLMIGTEIPDRLPPPSQAFLRIFNAGNPDQQFDSTDGSLTDLLEGAQRPPLLGGIGSGFAFGSTLEVNLDARTPGLGFYAKVAIAAGFDLNITQSSSRVCAESGASPGINDWYATGQFYAGIEGEIGLFVDLWFIEEEFPILNAMAAMVLQGGAPNPVWAEGKARIRYSILDGLLEGSHTFHAIIGDKCTPTNSNPFQDIDLIQDLKPSGQATVYARPEAAFAIKIDQIFEIPMYDDLTGEILPPRRIKAVIDEFYCKPNSGSNAIEGSISSLDDGYIYRINPTDVLNPNTDYTSHVSVKAKEFFPSQGWKFISDPKTGNVFKQSLSRSFKTGDTPQKLIVQNIRLSYPIHNQNNFLKKETQVNRGFIRLAQGRPNLLSDKINNSSISSLNKKAEFYARFISGGGTDTVTTPVIISSNKKVIEFSVSKLKNDKIYVVQIIKKLPNSVQELLSGNTTDQLGNYQIESINLLSGESTISSTQIKTIRLPDDQGLSEKEQLLYQYFFKTSKYDRFRDKLNVNINEIYEQALIGDAFTLGLSLEEDFEWCDKQNYVTTPGNHPSQKRCKPMVAFDIQERVNSIEFPANYFPGSSQNTYIGQKINPKIDITQSYLQGLEYIITSYKGRSINIKKYRPIYNYNYDLTVNLYSSNYYLEPLSQSSVESVFTFAIDPSLISMTSTLNSGSSSSSLTDLGSSSSITLGTNSFGGSPGPGSASTGGFSFFGGVILNPIITPKIKYHPSLYGVISFQQVQQNLVAFLNQEVEIGAGMSKKLKDIMWEEYKQDRIKCNRILIPDPYQVMKLNRGTHSIIAKYRYPDKDGVNYNKGSGSELKWIY